MKTYINNLLPRLKEFSQTLDKKELLVDQPWVLIDDDGNKQQYIFERSGRLIMSLNGRVQYGKWAYLPAAKSLLIDRADDSLLLNHAFFTKGVCILKQDGFVDQPWMLVNQNEVPDLNIERFLSELLPENKHFRVLAVESTEPILFNKEEFRQKGTIVGVTLKNHTDTPINTTLKVDNRNVYYVVQNNIVVRQYVVEVLKTNRGILKVNRGVDEPIKPGCIVYEEQGTPADGKYEILDHDVKKVTARAGTVVKVFDSSHIALLYLLAILGIIVSVLLLAVLMQ